MEKKKNILGISSMVVIGAVGVVAIVGAVLYFSPNGDTSSSSSDVTDGSAMVKEETADSMMEKDTSDAMMEGEDKMQGESVDEPDAMMEGEMTVVDVEGGSYYFDPDVIRVKKGEEVKIVLKSVDMMHDFVIDEFDVRTQVTRAGETSEVTFTANEAGEFEFYCSVGNHRALGMVGTLIVEE